MRIIAYAAEQSFQRVDRSASNAKRNMKSAGVTALFRLSTEKVSRTVRKSSLIVSNKSQETMIKLLKKAGIYRRIAETAEQSAV